MEVVTIKLAPRNQAMGDMVSPILQFFDTNPVENETNMLQTTKL